jgi:hypothetical protein
MPLVRYILFHLLRRFTVECRPDYEHQTIYPWCREWQLPIIGAVARLQQGRTIYRW